MPIGEPSCTGVSHHVRVTGLRPHTKEYNRDARERLGLAVQRARERAGYPKRPAFSDVSGVGVTSLWKLETGRPVGPSVYEAVARALPAWNEDTPKEVLEGADPPTVTAKPAPPSPPAESQVAVYDKEKEFFRAFIASLERQGVPRRVILQWVGQVVAELSQRSTDGNEQDATG